jgi:t-SNARE complex subunit (syntaxin)
MNLEQYIKDDRNAFDDKEPAVGHSERFAKKLKKQRRTKFRRRNVWLAAAVLTGIIIGTGFFVHYLGQESDNCSFSPEIETMCEYYEKIMDQEIEHLKVVLKDVEPSVQEKVLEDVENMKSDTKELLKQLCDGINDEQSIAIIKTNYEMKIKNIQFISSIVEEI